MPHWSGPSSREVPRTIGEGDLVIEGCRSSGVRSTKKGGLAPENPKVLSRSFTSWTPISPRSFYCKRCFKRLDGAVPTGRKQKKTGMSKRTIRRVYVRGSILDFQRVTKEGQGTGNLKGRLALRDKRAGLTVLRTFHFRLASPVQNRKKINK